MPEKVKNEMPMGKLCCEKLNVIGRNTSNVSRKKPVYL
jgi:hypothetical protein